MTQVIRVVPVLDFGGVERIVTTWANVLRNTRYRPRVCTFWKPGQAAEQLVGMNVPVDVLGVDPSVRNPYATIALARYLHRTPAAIVHASISEANLHTVIATRVVGNQAVVVEETGLPNRSAIGRAVFGHAYRRADAVVAVSRAVHDYLVEYERVPEGRIDVIYNCVDQIFGANTNQRSIRLKDQRFRILAVGRLHPVKNFDGLLGVIKEVVQMDRRVELSIAGDGAQRPVLERLVRDYGLQDHVRLLGYRADVAELMASADLFVLPSHSEGLSLALIEAVASGLPVLASNRGGNPEVLREIGGPIDLLLDPWDTEQWRSGILTFARMSEEERQEITLHLRRFVLDRFGQDRYRTDITDLYSHLL